LAPQFVLNSAPEDNILRACSYLREDSYNRLSNDKATVMRGELLGALSRFRTDHSIPLPDCSTDVDIVVEDAGSSTVVIAELKWYRKPSTYRERLRADEDFEDGFNRQLAAIRSYSEENPAWLKNRGTLARSLDGYENVHYLLIGRDHWGWFEPTASGAAVEFEQFRLAVGRHGSLGEAMRELLRYEWLPIESEDFHVRFDRAVVEDVALESEVYYGGPGGAI